jgi:hypothetical protein
LFWKNVDEKQKVPESCRRIIEKLIIPMKNSKMSRWTVDQALLCDWLREPAINVNTVKKELEKLECKVIGHKNATESYKRQRKASK